MASLSATALTVVLGVIIFLLFIGGITGAIGLDISWNIYFGVWQRVEMILGAIGILVLTALMVAKD